MKNFKFLLVLLSTLCLYACGNDGGGNDPDDTQNPDDTQHPDDTQNPKQDECNSDTFESECIGDDSYTVCKDSKKSTEKCPDNYKCSGGSCQPKSPVGPTTDCNEAQYRPECTDGGHTACQGGQIVTIPCGEGYHCTDGECQLDTVIPEPPDIHEIPTECDNSFVDKCYGNVRVSCKDNTVIQENCENEGLFCYYGECRSANTTTCTPGEFENKCIGNRLIKCDFETYTVDSYDCYNDVCATVNGVTDCYLSCTEQQSHEHQTSFCRSTLDKFDAECIESDDHHFVIENVQIDSEDEWVHRCSGGEFYCVNGECMDLDAEVLGDCSPESFEVVCKQNIAFTCEETNVGGSSYHLIVPSLCSPDTTCYVKDNQSYCLESCDVTLKDQTRSYCRYMEDENLTISIKEKCEEYNDAYYWFETEKTPCEFDCDEITAECLPNDNSCDEATDTNDRKVCHLGYQRSFVDVTYSYSSVTQHCAGSEWNTVDEIECVHGCDPETGECIHVDEIEDQNCSYGEQTCFDDNHILKCNNDEKYVLESCGNHKCTLNSGGSAECVIPCTSEEIDTVLYTECLNSGDEVAYTCHKGSSAQYDYYYMPLEYSCKRGCLGSSCIRKHPDEGRQCHSALYQQNCFNNILAYCSWYNDVAVQNCTENEQVCVDNISSPGCYDECTQEEHINSKPVCQTIEGQEYSVGRECAETSSGRYYWVSDEVVNTYCAHGCNAETGKCNTIHELEGKECHPINEDYVCDGRFILSCGASTHEFSAFDCVAFTGNDKAYCVLTNENYPRQAECFIK